MCLITHTLPALVDDEKVVILQRLLSTQKQKVDIKNSTALKALRLLDTEDDGKMFSTLRDRLEDAERERTVIERFGSAKERKQFATPDVLKNPRPDVSTSSNTSGFGAVLVWQCSMQSFQAYYPVEIGDEEDAGTRKKNSPVQAASTKVMSLRR